MFVLTLLVVVGAIISLAVVVLLVVGGVVHIIRTTFIITVSIIIDGLRFGKHVRNAVSRVVTLGNRFSR